MLSYLPICLVLLIATPQLQANHDLTITGFSAATTTYVEGTTVSVTCVYYGITDTATLKIQSTPGNEDYDTHSVSTGSATVVRTFTATKAMDGKVVHCKIGSVTSTATVTLTVNHMLSSTTYVYTDGTSSLTITCKASHATTSMAWYQSDGNTAITIGVAQVNGTDRTLVPFVAPSNDTKYWCRATFPADSGLSLSAEYIVVVYTAVITGSTVVNLGSSAGITCTYTYNPNGTSIASISHDNTPVVSELYDNEVSTVVKEKIHIISTVAFSHAGTFGCSVTHDGSITASATSVPLYVRGPYPSASLSTVYTTKGSTVTLTCKFKGDNPLSIAWKDASSNLLSTTGDYTLGTKSYAADDATNTLTIATVSYSESQVYTCEASWTAVASYTSTQTQRLQATEIIMAATSTIVQKEFEYHISCSYSKDLSNAIGVTWYHGSTAFNTAQNAKVSDETTTDSNLLRKVYIIHRASETDTGSYHCVTSYNSGSHTETGVAESVIVRGADSNYRTYNSVGSSTTLSCKIYGDETTTLTWKKPDYTTITSTGDYTVGSTSYTSASKESTSQLTITNLATAKAGDYKCVATWIANVPNNITQTFMVTVPGVPTLASTGVTSNLVTLGSSFTLTCTFEEYSDAVPTISWFKYTTMLTTSNRIEKINRNAANYGKSLYKVTTATGPDTGSYVCKVTYPSNVLVESSAMVVSVRKLTLTPSMKTLHVRGDTISWTCQVYGENQNSLNWYHNGMMLSNVANLIQITTGAITFGVVTSKLSLLKTDASSGGNYTCGAEFTDGAKINDTASLVLIGGVKSVTSSKPHANQGDGITLTCTYDDDMIYDHVVTWYFGSTVLSSSTRQASHKSMSYYTITSATHAMNGMYSCGVRYGTIGEGKMGIYQYVRYIDVPSTTVHTTTDTSTSAYTITCKFYGDSTTTTTWTKEGSAGNLTDGSSYTLVQGTWDSVTYLRTSKLIIKNPTVSSGGGFNCKTVYNGTLLSGTQTVNFLGISSPPTASKNPVNKGESVTMTCIFTAMPSGQSGSLTVKWTRDGTTLATESPSGTTSYHIITSTAVSDNGEYHCHATYGSIGSATSSKLTLYIRTVVPTTNSNVYAVLGSTVTISCTYYGDVMGDTTWYKTNTIITSGKTKGTYADYKRTDLLTLTSVTSAEAQPYKCSVTYIVDNVNTQSTQTLHITTSTPTVTLTIPSQTTLNQAATITCTHGAYTLGSSEGTFSINIYKNGEALTGLTTSGTTTTYAITSLSGTDTGKYKCVATYGNYGDVTTTSQDYKIIAATEITPTVGITGQILYLTCHTYGELVADTAVAWTYGAGPLPSGVAKHIVAATTANDDKFYRPFYVKIDSLSSSNTGAYSCTVTFSTGNKVASLASITAKSFSITSAAAVEIITVGTTTSFSCVWTLDATESSMAASIQWYKDNAKHGSLKTATGGSTSDTLTLTSVSISNAGAYHCAVTFGSYGTITSSTKTHIVVTDVSPITNTNTVKSLIGNTETMTCTFTSSSLMTVTWSHNSAASTSTSESSGTYNSDTKQQTSTFTYTGMLASDTPICTATITCPAACTGNQLTSTQTITVLGISSLLSSKGQASVNDSVTLTCSYSTSSSPTPTEKWYRGTTQLTTVGGYTITSTSGTSKLSFPSNKITASDNGVYKCAVNYGTSTGTHTKTLNQYVRHVEHNSTVFALVGRQVILTCIVYGDEPQATTWLKGSSSISNDPSYRLIAGHYIAMKRYDTLVISEAPADGSVFTCSTHYTSGTPETLTGTITVYTTGVGTHPTSTVQQPGFTATLTAATTSTKASLVSVVWRDGNPANDWTDSSPTTTAGSTSGYNTYTSKMVVRPEPHIAARTYNCIFNLTSSPPVMTKNATVFRGGFAFFNSTGGDGDYLDAHENYSIHVAVFTPLPISYISAKFILVGGNESSVSLIKGPAMNGTVGYRYTPSPSNRKSGALKVSVTYTNMSHIKFTNISHIYHVKSRCKVGMLPNVTNGTWLPSGYLEFRNVTVLKCDSGFYSHGISTATCLKNGTFSFVGKPNCTATSKLSCGKLPTTANGSVTYLNATSAKYVCHKGYTLSGNKTIYSCSSVTKKWSLYSADNPTGTAPTCEKTVSASSRTASLSCSFSGITSSFCTTDQQKATIKAALETAVKTNNTISCLNNGKCNMTTFTCTYDSANTKLLITFKLVQIYDLEYPSVLTDDVTTFKSSSIYLTYNDGTKRATVTTNTISDAAASTSTTCPSNYLDDDSGNCVQCNLGYGNDGGKCKKCSLGMYSSVKDISACMACSGTGVTTMNTGSNSSSDCIQTNTVCVVPGDPTNGKLVPASTARIVVNTDVSVFCRTGYAVAFGVPAKFPCQTGAKVPTCDEKCYLKMYTSAVMAERNMKELTQTELRNKETVRVKCLDGYKWEMDKKLDTMYFACDSRNTTIEFGRCNRDYTLYIVIGGAAGGLLLFVVIICCIKCCCCNKKKEKKRKGQPRVNMAASHDGGYRERDQRYYADTPIHGDNHEMMEADSPGMMDSVINFKDKYFRD